VTTCRCINCFQPQAKQFWAADVGPFCDVCMDALRRWATVLANRVKSDVNA